MTSDSLQLYLLRHAKSAWDDEAASDRDRTLNNRGRRDAPRMGAALAGYMAPMPVHVSPAQRAQLTLGGLCDGWPALSEQPHYTVEALYTFSLGDLVEWLREAGDAAALFIVGHNPAFTELVNWVCGRQALDNLPTAGFVHLELQAADWSSISPGCGEIRHYQFPRDLADD
jgi:phosphohistidine phosphatase